MKTLSLLSCQPFSSCTYRYHLSTYKLLKMKQYPSPYCKQDDVLELLFIEASRKKDDYVFLHWNIVGMLKLGNAIFSHSTLIKIIWSTSKIHRNIGYSFNVCSLDSLVSYCIYIVGNVYKLHNIITFLFSFSDLEMPC